MRTLIPFLTSFLTCWGPRGALLSHTDWVSLLMAITFCPPEEENLTLASCNLLTFSSPDIGLIRSMAVSELLCS